MSLELIRGLGEKIVINDTTTVHIKDFNPQSQQFCFAIDAPHEVKVWREELWRKMQPKSITPMRTL